MRSRRHEGVRPSRSQLNNCRLDRGGNRPVKYSRRDLRLLLPALASAKLLAQQPKILPAGVFRYEDLPVRANGLNKGRNVLNGETHSGFPIEIHLTELGPGQEP